MAVLLAGGMSGGAGVLTLLAGLSASSTCASVLLVHHVMSRRVRCCSWSDPNLCVWIVEYSGFCKPL